MCSVPCVDASLGHALAVGRRTQEFGAAEIFKGCGGGFGGRGALAVNQYYKWHAAPPVILLQWCERVFSLHYRQDVIRPVGGEALLDFVVALQSYHRSLVAAGEKRRNADCCVERAAAVDA